MNSEQIRTTIGRWCNAILTRAVRDARARDAALLQLYGDPHAYGIAGLAAAVVGGVQIGGGVLVPHLGRAFRLRTSDPLADVAPTGDAERTARP